MNQPSSKKTLIAFMTVVVIGALMFFYTKGSPTDNESSLESSRSPESLATDAIGSKALVLLNQVSSLKIDASIFNSQVYQSLVDYSVQIPTQNVGRPNPFSPFYTPVNVSSSKTTGNR